MPWRRPARGGPKQPVLTPAVARNVCGFRDNAAHLSRRQGKLAGASQPRKFQPDSPHTARVNPNAVPKPSQRSAADGATPRVHLKLQRQAPQRTIKRCVFVAPGPRVYIRVSTKAKPTPVQSRQRPKIHRFRRFPFLKIKRALPLHPEARLRLYPTPQPAGMRRYRAYQASCAAEKGEAREVPATHLHTYRPRLERTSCHCRIATKQAVDATFPLGGGQREEARNSRF